ncbi:fibrous sheath-interacting protein 2-like, partial [Echinops telfairi]|uniref:Fibrous sheath-interacting protein 2-like n=1 Tax=Echinops telfairi TaxID=9371 RepID=A0AC55DEI7_ECHTE
KFIEKEVNKLVESRKAQEHNILRFHEGLLDQDPQITKIQQKMLRQSYRDMAQKEIDKLQHISEKPSPSFQMKEEEETFQAHDWKTEEMLLLTKIDEEVKRQKKIEEQQWKRREQINQKKKALLKKRITHHLRKMQPICSERQVREDIGNNDNTAVAEVN